MNKRYVLIKEINKLEMEVTKLVKKENGIYLTETNANVVEEGLKLYKVWYNPESSTGYDATYDLEEAEQIYNKRVKNRVEKSA